MGRRTAVLAGIASAGAALVIACGAFSSSDPAGVGADAQEVDAASDADDSACSADLQSDPTNCGACGRKCQGACRAGACETEKVADSPGILTLAASNDVVVWADPLVLMGCSARGPCAAEEIRRFTGGSFFAVATAGQRVVFAWEKNVIICDAKVGCPNGNTVLLGPWDKGALAMDGADVFATDRFRKLLYRCPAPAFCSTVPEPLAVGADVASMALTTLHVYWANASGLRRCLKTGCNDADGGPPPEVEVARADIAGVAHAGGAIFFTGRNAGEVLSCPVSGCAGGPRVVAAGQNAPSAIVAEGKLVAWVNEGDGAIMGCEANACGMPTVLARIKAGPALLAISSAHVYVAPRGEGPLQRVPR